MISNIETPNQEIINRCSSRLHKYRFVIDYDKHSKKLMDCIDDVMEIEDMGKIGEKVRICASNYEKNVEK